jgi:hypothetical protein
MGDKVLYLICTIVIVRTIFLWFIPCRCVTKPCEPCSIEGQDLDGESDILFWREFWQLQSTATVPGDDVIVVDVKTDLGLGNRLPSLATSALLSVALNRRLLIRWPGSSFLARNFPANFPTLSCEQSERVAKLCDDALLHARRVQLLDKHGALKVLARGQDLRRFYADERGKPLYFASADYLAPLLLLNERIASMPAVESLIEAADCVHGNVGGVLLRGVLGAPSAQLRERMDRVLGDKWLSSPPLVGIHVRTRKTMRRGKSVSPSLMIDVARELAAAAADGQHNATTTIYVASDDAGAMRRHLDGNGNGDVVLLNGDEHGDDRETFDLIELLALSQCRSLVLTEGSSFSWTAASLGNVASSTYVSALGHTWRLPRHSLCMFATSALDADIQKRLPLFQRLCHPLVSRQPS